MTREEIIEYLCMFNVHGDIKHEEMADDLAQPTSPCALCIYSPPRPCTVCEDCPAKGRET